MKAIVVSKSSYKRANAILIAEDYPYTTVTAGCDSVYFVYELPDVLSFASESLYSAGILHRCVIR